MDAANRRGSSRPGEDRPIGKEHWEHDRSPALTECEERSQVGNRGRFPARKHRQPKWLGADATPDSRASRNHRWLSRTALQKCLRPMLCRISAFPPSSPFPQLRLRHDAERRCNRRIRYAFWSIGAAEASGLVPGSHNASALNYTGQNYEKNAI